MSVDRPPPTPQGRPPVRRLIGLKIFAPADGFCLPLHISVSLLVRVNGGADAWALKLLRVIRGCGTLGLEHRGKKHLFGCLCGCSPAWSRAGFSEVCCDLTGPVTGGTVNIRLSCDSRCSLQEAQKGQRLLMPSPTSTLSDFISPPVQPSHFKRTRHRRCCVS